MQVISSDKSLSINTCDMSKFTFLRDLMHKNFSQNIGRRSKLISFYVEDELAQRRYFLKLLKKRAAQDCKLEEEAVSKIFKLNFELENCLRPLLAVRLHLENPKIILELDAKNEVFYKYLQNYFKDHNCYFDANYFILYCQGDRTFQGLKQLLRQKNHLHFDLEFLYEEKELESFFANFHKMGARIKRQRRANKLLAPFYEVLSLPIDADMKALKAAYHKKSRMYHTDFHSEKSSEAKALLKERFLEICEAYEAIKSFLNRA